MKRMNRMKSFLVVLLLVCLTYEHGETATHRPTGRRNPPGPLYRTCNSLTRAGVKRGHNFRVIFSSSKEEAFRRAYTDSVGGSGSGNRPCWDPPHLRSRTGRAETELPHFHKVFQGGKYDDGTHYTYPIGFGDGNLFKFIKDNGERDPTVKFIKQKLQYLRG